MAYGTDSIVPLLGGSGGGSNASGGASGGGAGGGAILIASSMNITLESTGGIFANGGDVSFDEAGSGSGSGGGIRLIAHAVSGSGTVCAVGGTTGNAGGVGRIRVDGGNGLIKCNPQISSGPLGPIFPQAAARLRATTVGGNAVPIDPLGTVFSGDVGFTTDGQVIIGIEAQNVPVGLTVTVRIVQKDGGASFVIFSTPLNGTFEQSTAAATAMSELIPPGPYEVHLSLQLP